MNASRIRLGLAVGFLGLALSTGTAVAQAPCTASDCAPQGPEVVVGGEVGGESGGSNGAPGGVEAGGEQAGGEQAGGSDTAGAAAQAAPEGTLPFTGGDVAGLVLIGGAAIGAGALLLRRSKTTVTA